MMRFDKLLFFPLLFSLVGLIPISDVSLSGYRYLPFDAPYLMVLYQCGLILLGVAIFYVARYAFAKVEKPVRLFYLLVAIVVLLIVALGRFRYASVIFWCRLLKLLLKVPLAMKVRYAGSGRGMF